SSTLLASLCLSCSSQILTSSRFDSSTSCHSPGPFLWQLLQNLVEKKRLVGVLAACGGWPCGRSGAPGKHPSAISTAPARNPIERNDRLMCSLSAVEDTQHLARIEPARTAEALLEA